MKSKYRRYDMYLESYTETTLLNMKQELSLRLDRPQFDRSFTLMKIKRHNINKAMKRLQLYKARNIEIQWFVEKSITQEYKEYNNG